jgi:hypothetical protein
MVAKATLFPALSSISIFDYHDIRKRYFVSVRRGAFFIIFCGPDKSIMKGENKGNESKNQYG